MAQEKFYYSRLSKKRLSECHEDLQKIANELIKELDVTILCGHRNKADQDAAVARGNSRLKWPKSKHNKMPALAVDIAPYPISWSKIERFDDMCKRVEKIAKRLGIKIRLGRDFKGLVDWPHIELV